MPTPIELLVIVLDPARDSELEKFTEQKLEEVIPPKYLLDIVICSDAVYPDAP